MSARPPLRPERVAAIQARHDAATPGHWHLDPEPHTDPDAVRTTVSGWHHGIGVLQFRGWKAAENREFVLNALDDIGELLADRERYADRADLVARIGELELALGGAVGMLFSAELTVSAGLLPDLDKLRQGAEELRQIQYAPAEGSLARVGEERPVPAVAGADGPLAPGAYNRMRAALGVVHAARRQHGEGVVPLVRALESSGLLGSPEAPAGATVWRAGHHESGIPLGHYTSREAAMGHIHVLLAREESVTVPEIQLRVIWRADEPEADGTAWECWLVDADGADDKPTSYVVTPLTVDTEYDPDGAE